jgi:hypothetical protein
MLWYGRLDGNPLEPLLPPLPHPPFDVVFYPIDNRHPPTVSVKLLGVNLSEMLQHPQTAFVALHKRRVFYRGHRVGRMNGFERGCYFAWLSFKRAEVSTGTGVWPLWDPLHRTPAA